MATKRAVRPDLVIDGRSDAEMREWLAPWDWCLHGRFEPLLFNRFGCSFLLRPDKSVEMLDVFFGQVDPVAASLADFEASVEDPAWQEVYFLSEFVVRLHVAGKIASGTSCYAIAPHPAVGGPDPWSETPLETEAVMVMEASVWQGICAQFVRTAREAR